MATGQPNSTMWDNQSAFYKHTTQTLADILNILHCKLDHMFYLIGFPTEELPNPPIPCCYPEDGDILDNGLDEVFREIKDDYRPQKPEVISLPGLPGLIPADSHEAFCHKLQQAIHEYVKECVNLGEKVPFCSLPFKTQTHVVCLVLIISRADHDAYPHLEAFETCGAHGLLPSFLFAIIHTFLEEFAPEIAKPDVTSFLYFMSRDPREIIRRAGAVL
jgi:hypothetical protein